MISSTEFISAETHLTNLKSKRVAAVARMNELSIERDRISFEAHTAGGEARKHLTAVLDSHVKLSGEIASFDAAIVEAGRRVSSEAREAANAEQRRKASEARILLETVQASAKQIDQAAASVVSATQTFFDAMKQIERLGFGPRTELVHLNLQRALESALVGTALQLAPVAPGNRTKAESLADGWAVQVNNRTSAVLCDGNTDETPVRVAI